MIARLAVLPYPPLLVPDLTVRSDSRLEHLRGACLRAVTSVTESATEWVAVGVDGFRAGVYGPRSGGTFAGYGVPVPVSLEHGVPTEPGLPLPGLIAGWFREQAGAARVTVHVLDADAGEDEIARLAHRVVAGPAVGVLVLSEGSRRRNERSPRPPHPDAAAVDARLAAALATADTNALHGLEPSILSDVGVDTVPALRFLATAADASGHDWRPELLYDDTPFGISYHVALWSPSDD
ncbi:hypothetical protein GIY23_07895 [Allosaccharopolyspora coralli]|uniref:Uncharacterized protein n=1 Tax=Allosaccharopolyspora coralli TaxID=2665642 RepID=A0A5Q3Q546_9PSEU|nr:hypothetical protein [Allosaccharopolyspora coralli]QGK69453.1 hypothetical protein GIY23_07895 [Allosaccharopolyspora coralli]